VQKETASTLQGLLQAAREGDDPASVRAAIMELGYGKRSEVYPVLVEKLDDPNPSVQHAAVISLGRFGRAEAIDELIKPKIFRSPNAQIRWAAVTAVGRLGDYRVIDDLLRAVEDPEWIVRTQAVTELMGKVKQIIALKDPRLARILIHMFSLENDEIIDLAMEGFREIGPESLHWLHDALQNPSPTIRANAARTLGRMKSHGSTPYLQDLLGDPESLPRAAACEALGLIGDKMSIEPLVLMIQDNVARVQEAAATAIARFGRPATVPLLNALSRERDKFAQRAFIKCLGRIGDPKSVPALISYLRSSYFLVRQAAVASLVQFGPIVTGLLIPTLSFNTSDIEKLEQDACDKEHPELQMRAIKALGGLEDHRAVPVLKEIVETGLPDIEEAASHALFQIGCAAWGRCCALKVIGEVASESFVPLIAPSLRDDSDNVRFEAVRAIGKMGGPEAVKHLVRMFRKDKADFVRREAIRLLRTAGLGQEPVLEAGRRGLKDGSREVRVQAARLLGSFQDRKSILPLLKAMADPHWSVRESAETALLNFGRDAVEPLIEALGSPSWTTRFRAARLLGEIGDPRAVSPLKAILARRGERRGVRDVAETSLRKLEKAVAN
jgi:HEAT repeat protein